VVGSGKRSVAHGRYEVSFYVADTHEVVRWRGKYFVSQTFEKKSIYGQQLLRKVPWLACPDAGVLPRKARLP